MTLVRFAARIQTETERKRRFCEKSEMEWTKWAPGRRRKRDGNREGGKESILTWDRLSWGG